MNILAAENVVVIMDSLTKNGMDLEIVLLQDLKPY